MTNFANENPASTSIYGTEKNYSIWGWGDSSTGSIGPNASEAATANNKAPIQAVNDKRWSQVSTKYSHIMAISEDGMLYGWGLSEAGRVGAGNAGVKNILFPQRIGERTDWKCVAAGFSHSYAIDGNEDLWGTGENTHGALMDPGRLALVIR